MRVSKLIIILSLAMSAAILIVSPAIAVEHPWEEGESGGGGRAPDDAMPGPGDDIVPPSDDDTPLWSSVDGTHFLWWLVVWEYVTGGRVNTSYYSGLKDDTASRTESVTDHSQVGRILR